jgi:hypothetical protein
MVAIRELTLILSVSVAMRAPLHADASMLFSRATSGAIEQTPRIL